MLKNFYSQMEGGELGLHGVFVAQHVEVEIRRGQEHATDRHQQTEAKCVQVLHQRTKHAMHKDVHRVSDTTLPVCHFSVFFFLIGLSLLPSTNFGQ